jgi:hypothetical protein
MKSTQLCIPATLLLINPAIAQQNTYSPTSSSTSLSSDLLIHTIAPTGGGVERVPRPTPVPGSETYWPTIESAFLDYDMQIVEVAGSPVPTVIRLDGEGVGTESGADDESGEASHDTNEEVPSNGAPTPAANEQSTNDGVLRRNNVLEMFAIGVVSWLGLL